MLEKKSEKNQGGIYSKLNIITRKMLHENISKIYKITREYSKNKKFNTNKFIQRLYLSLNFLSKY